MIGFDLRSISERGRFDYWAALGGRTFATTASREARERIAVRSRVWRGRGLVLSRFEASAFTTIRGAAELRAEPADVIKVKLYASGRTHVMHGDAVDVLNPGALHIIDQSRPKTEVSTERNHLALMVCHARVGYDPAHHGILRSLASDTGDGAVLADAMLALEAAVAREPGGLHRERVDGLLAALRAILADPIGVEEDGDLRAARAAAMHRLVAADPMARTVGVEALADRFGISRASVYRAFARHGGIEQFRLRCRLDMAFRALAQTDARRGVVGQAAERFGFHSDSHFNRAFRSRFGAPPGEVVGAAVISGTPADGSTSGVGLTRDPAGRFADLMRIYSLLGMAGPRTD